MQYTYDAGGRLLRRTADPTGTPVTTLNYWLGLNRIAEEQWGTESGKSLAVLIPDQEGHPVWPTWNGWMPFDWEANQATWEYTNDAERGNVFHVVADGHGSNGPTHFMQGDNDSNGLSGFSLPWGDTGRRHLALWEKTGGSGQHFVIEVLTMINDGYGEYETSMYYMTDTTGSPWDDGAIYTPIGGEGWEDGAWHYFERDLQADLDAVRSDNVITEVNGIIFHAYDGIYLDDMVLSGGKLKRSYQMIPGLAVGGVLGSWTGPNVTPDNSNRVRYFHYNDLGTVLAQTKSNGTKEGVWEPDFWGNYEGRYTYGGSPTRPELGLTGQVYDSAFACYQFCCRIFDSERARWLSEEPFGEGPNLYNFVKNDPIDFWDFAGLYPMDPPFDSRGGNPKGIDIPGQNDGPDLGRPVPGRRKPPTQWPNPGDKWKWDRSSGRFKKGGRYRHWDTTPGHTPHWDEEDKNGNNHENIYPGPATCEAVGRTVTIGIVTYIIISEGSRLFPPRNLLPIP